MPRIQLLHHCSYTALLTSRGKHNPGSGYLFIRKASTTDTSNGNIVDELARMCKETVLNFMERYLGTRDFESILNFEMTEWLTFECDSMISETHLCSISKPKNMDHIWTMTVLCTPLSDLIRSDQNLTNSAQICSDSELFWAVLFCSDQIWADSE